MNRLKRLAYFVIVLVIAQACGGSKKVVQVIPEVEWAKSRPNLPSYYVGIGQSNKVGTPNEYMQTAKQNALADMASDISVNISSNSVISAFETQNLFFEDYSQTIKAETQKELEGYELVDSWEDEKQYWVYYRLSKAQYQKLSEVKKTSAALKSVDFYSKALESIDNGDLRTGIVLLIKALEPIKQYFSETISVTFRGQEIYLGNEIIQKFTQTVNSLVVNGPQSIDAKIGTGVTQDQLSYQITNSDGVPQRGIQLKATYSEKVIQNSKSVTGVDGKVGYSIDVVRSDKNQEKFTVTVDLDNLIKEGTTESILKKMLTKVTTPTLPTTVNIVKPKLFVKTGIVSKNDNILSQAASSKLLMMGVPIVNSESEADYTLIVSSSMSEPTKASNYTLVQVAVTVVLKNASGAEVYRKALDKIKGSHFDTNQAISAAYAEASKKIENSIIREIVENVIKGRKAY